MRLQRSPAALDAKRKVVAPGLSPVRLISSINDFFTIVGQQVLEKQ